MEAEHISVLYYSNAQWLSPVNVLSRIFELREKILNFLNKKNIIIPINFPINIF